jgi:outer membrane receptor for ferrienterochelin and colicins
MAVRTLKASLFAAAAALGFDASQAEAQSGESSASTGGPGDGAVQEVVVTAKKLDAARASIQPETGASTYTITRSQIQLIPGGDNTSFDQIVLQMPGVVQDSYGQFHVRGMHASIQYRFNGVILPQGLSFFGQVLSPRIVDSVKLVDGALPAEYGLQTAAILDITTRSGLENGGQVGIYGGSHGEWEPSIEYGGTSGANSYFVSASYLQDQLGIGSPDSSSTPLHDRTTQEQAFGYFDHDIDTNSRFSVIAGFSNQDYQIPNQVGQEPSMGYQYGGRTTLPSQDLNANQKELNAFVAGSYLYSTQQFTGQVSMYTRYSSLEYLPDVAGEMLYNGFEQYVNKQDVSVGLQAEGAYHFGPNHTVRAGLIVDDTRSYSATTGEAFLADTNVNSPGYGQALPGDQLATIVDNGTAQAQTYSVYVQDEWKVFNNFVLNYGLRFDQLSSYRSENQLSPRVNFVWTPLPGATVHGGYSRLFTPPPFGLVNNETLSKYYGTVNYPYGLAANSKQKVDTMPYAERDNYFDLGIEQKITPAFKVGLDAYDRQAHNLLDEGQFGEAVIMTPFNYKYGEIYGAEFTTSYNKGPFSAYWNLAYTHDQGKDIESAQFNFTTAELAYISNHYIYLDHDELWSSSFGASYRWHNTTASLDGIYGSGLRATGANGVPNGVALQPYTVFNLSLLQHVDFIPAAGPLDVRFDIVNLFDKQYEIRNGTGVGVGEPVWGARRGLFVGVSKKF